MGAASICSMVPSAGLYPTIALSREERHRAIDNPQLWGGKRKDRFWRKESESCLTACGDYRSIIFSRSSTVSVLDRHPLADPHRASKLTLAPIGELSRNAGDLFCISLQVAPSNTVTEGMDNLTDLASN